MDDEIIHSWCFHDAECFDSTPSAVIIILDKDLESFSSLRSQQDQDQTDDISSVTFKARDGGRSRRSIYDPTDMT